MSNNKRDLQFYLNIYRKILIQDLKSKMSYRADFIISTFGMIMTISLDSLPSGFFLRIFQLLMVGITIICYFYMVSHQLH